MYTKDDKELEEIYSETMIEEGWVDRLAARKAGFKHKAMGAFNKFAANVNSKVAGDYAPERSNAFNNVAEQEKNMEIKSKLKVLMDRHLIRLDKFINNFYADIQKLGLTDAITRGNDNYKMNQLAYGDEEFTMLKQIYSDLKKAENGMNKYLEFSNATDKNGNPAQVRQQ